MDEEATNEYLVFLKDGTFVTEVTATGLHNLAVREDYAYALDTTSLPDVVLDLCEEYGLPPKVYAGVIQDAMLRGAITAGSAACMTLETQKASDAYFTKH